MFWLDLEHACFHPGQKNLNLILSDKFWDCLKDSVFGKFTGSEGKSFAGEIKNRSVEKF